ncbi:MAG: hypothetical protein ACTSRG_12765 [Candidatus Helarchaeota archaeon]
MRVKVAERTVFVSLFFVGFAGGVYESLFANEIIYIVGVSLKAISVTISSFFLGLGVGGFVLGKRADKLTAKNKIKYFVRIELSLILMIILGYILLQFIPLLKYTAFSITFSEILILVSTFAILFSISFFMGGEIPIALSIRKSWRQSKKNDIGELSGWGNLADSIGGGMSFLIPWFLPFYIGMQNTLITTLLLNVTSTLLMLVLYYRTKESKLLIHDEVIEISFRKSKRKRRIIAPYNKLGRGINKIKKHKFLITCITIIGISSLFIFDIGGLNKTTSTYFQQLLYKDHLLYSQQSPYQHVDIVQNYYWGDMLFLDYDLQLTTRDEFIYHESLVHTAMLTHENPKNVLIIGGGDGGALREVCKYNVESITLVELDPAVVGACRSYMPIDYGAFFDSRVKVYYTDGRTFLDTAGLYDVIIVDLPDPDDFRIAALYTVEFYQSVYDHLNPTGGVFVTQSTSIYFNLYAFINIYQSIYTVFGNQYTFPYHNWVPSLGDWGFIIGIKGLASLPSSSEIQQRINDRNLMLLSFSATEYNTYFSFPAFINATMSTTPYTPSTINHPIIVTLIISRKTFTFQFYGENQFQELMLPFIGPIIIIGLILIISILTLRRKKLKYVINTNELENFGVKDQFKKHIFSNN